MMNIPGNLIRGAGSVVASVASGRRGSSDISNEIVVKEKSLLTVKETPVKDATTTSGLSTLTSYLIKRNEQGIWQKRYCCLVPHLFLYYFDSDTSESPRGIIDLEYFTALETPSENVLRISTPNGVSSRSFYFQIDDPSLMSQWMSSLHRDRYPVMREERDAYRELQAQFSGQMDFTMKMVEEYGTEKDRLAQEISKGQKLLENLVTSFQSIFQLLSEEGSDESIPTVDKTNLDVLATLLEKKMLTMKSTYQNQIELEKDTCQKERDLSEGKIEQLEKQLATEIQARRLLETQALQEKRENETRMREALAQIEKSNQNYQVVWGVKSSLEEKLSITNEQKKVLIKEVKTLRKKVDEVGSSNEELRDVNGNLENAILELQKQLESQKSKFESLLAEAVANGGNQEINSQILESAEFNTTDLVQTALKASSEAKQHKGYASSGSIETEDNPTLAAGDSISRTHTTDSPHQSRSSRVSSDSVVSTSILPPPPLPVDLDGNAIEWDHETREKMLQMDWLSPEQRALLQDRQKEELPFFDSDSSGGRKRSIVQMTTNLFHLDKSEKTHIDADTTAHAGGGGGGSTTTTTSNAEKHDTHEESKISFRRLSAIFHSNPSSSSTSEKIDPPSTPPSIKVEIPTTTTTATATHATPDSHNETGEGGGGISRTTSAAIPICYKCGGTVEGPKYSTCKCDIPQMTPIVEESAMDQFKGLFSKGKNAAKKAGSVVTGSLLKGRSEENQLSESQHHTPPPPSHESISSPRSPLISFSGTSNPATTTTSTATKKTTNLLSLDEPPASESTKSSTPPESSTTS